MKLALCCGLNYTGTSSELFGCIHDAEDMESALTTRGFEVKKLLERDATRDGILTALREMVAKLTYGDLGLFSISSHGSWIPDNSGDEADGRDEILIPWDIEEGEGHWVTDDDLAEIFGDRARGARVIMFSDSCHSGTISRMSRWSDGPQERRVRFLPPTAFMNSGAMTTAVDDEITMTTKLFINPRARANSRIGSAASLLLAGCTDRQFSYDGWFNGRANGAFTRAALDSLAEIHNPASYAEWHRKIRTKLPSTSYPQTPQIYGPKYMAKWQALEEGR